MLSRNQKAETVSPDLFQRAVALSFAIPDNLSVEKFYASAFDRSMEYKNENSRSFDFVDFAFEYNFLFSGSAQCFVHCDR
jgi:hypothetical protein